MMRRDMHAHGGRAGLTRINSENEASGGYHKGNEKNVRIHRRVLVLDVSVERCDVTALEDWISPPLYLSSSRAPGEVHGSQQGDG